MEESALPLHHCHVHKPTIIINRLHTLLHLTSIFFLIYYRTSFLLQQTKLTLLLLPHLLLFFSELLLSFIWLLRQSYRWRPVSRTVFPERLPGDDELPGIDVFVCTADPSREPTVGVMNTVLSAMALDYPPDKLHVYVSDDGGSSVTLLGTKEAWKFGKWWVPFCKKFKIKTICPQAYFSGSEDDGDDGSVRDGNDEFVAERKIIEEHYEAFKQILMRAREEGHLEASRDHPPLVEVIGENEATEDINNVKMPQLVYVSREKKPSHPHNFKAGALNALIRVSGVMSNSPYILVLDCDMYCNDPTSARQAMCFHFDPKIYSSLAFVQFPQRFRSLVKDDIYDSEFRSIFQLLWHGLDGLRGPALNGTNFYIKREALYDKYVEKGGDITELKNMFGSSNEFLNSLHGNHDKPRLDNSKDPPCTLLRDAKVLASCDYENNTKWGQKVGFMYGSLLEDFLTSLTLHCKGWKSVYLNPPRPQFLGNTTTNLNDLLVHGSRGSQGLVEVGMSKFCPLIYGPSCRLSFLQTMAYAEFALFPLFEGLAILCFATIPPLCLLNGITLYPQVSSSFFNIFLFIFLSSLAKHLHEVLTTGGSIKIWKTEQRMWMIKLVASYLYGCLYAIMEKLGLREALFLLTNKVDDNEQIKRYQEGIFDFRTSTMILAPMVTIILLNLTSLFGGLLRIIVMKDDWEKMFAQIFMSFYILIMNYPIIEGMLVRTDKARIPMFVTMLSAIILAAFLSLGSIVLKQ